MNLDDLGLVMRDIGNFDMGKFPGRLSLQKTVFLLQTFGVNLGYAFRWHLHGVYCPELTRDGYRLDKIGLPVQEEPLQFVEQKDQESYLAFSEFIRERKDSPDMLEIAASVAYLANAGFERNEVLHMVETKKPRFTRADCEKAWDDLTESKVIN